MINLDRTICPCCGTENPISRAPDYFVCPVCDATGDGGLPTIRELIAGETELAKDKWNGARLDLFLKTLLKL